MMDASMEREYDKEMDKQAMAQLGITPDQLLIARSLDREKVGLIRELLSHTIFDTKQAMLSAQGILSFLPNFPEDKP